MNRKSPIFILLFLVATSLTAQISFQDLEQDYIPSESPTLVIQPTNFYISGAVRDMPQCIDRSIFDSKVVPKGNGEESISAPLSAKRKRKLAHLNSAGDSPTDIDPLIAGPETYTRAANDRTPLINFESIGLNTSPPDPSMAVGPNHVVAMENGLWSVYSKTGVEAAGFPKTLNNPLTGPNHGDNGGDPVVMYDRQADRWFISQFQLSSSPALTNDVFLIGISTTPDPTGSYFVYEYELTQGNDYPHYGVWGDSYVTAGNFTGPQKVYTFNRIKMLAGDGSAEIVGFSPSGLGANGFAAPIPVHSERDVTPTGDIKIVFYQDDAFPGVSSDHIGLWNIDMDWSNIGSSTISGKIQIPTAPFDAAIAGGFANLQQPGTSQRIDAIVGAVMNMVHWYEFGTHQSIVLNWVVEIQNGTRKSGIRWVELRSTNGGNTWSVYQEGTFSDPTQVDVANKESVFMGCITMDSDGNIGLGYTKTGSSTFPSLYYTGRLASDALGTMSFGENLVISGTNSVNVNDRYGDYGQGVTDPSDDKTFWVTSEYSGDGGSNGRQSRIYSYRIAAAAPEISFATISESISESPTACFTDIDLPLNIALAPSDDAVVNFAINGASTATTDVDFELLTSSITFLAGQTAGQSISVRLFHDGLVEIDETLVIDFTVTTVGDALANTAADTYTMNIISTDAAPTPTANVTLIDEDFESAVTGWLEADLDGDTYRWTFGSPIGSPAHLTSRKLFSQSWISGVGPLTPDNYISPPELTIPSTLTSATITYEVAPATLVNPWYEEYYTVYWVTVPVSSLTIADINASPQIKPGGIINQSVETETIDMTPYIGQTGFIFFRHHNCTNQEYIAIDDLSLVGATATNVQTAVNLGTADQLNMESAGAAYAYDLSTDNVIASISNNQADDYGCSTVAVSRAGTGAQGYNGSAGADRVLDKTFIISTTNTIGSGDTSITFFFEEAEIAGWEGLTGLNRNVDLVIGRGNASSIAETSTVTIGAFGTGNVSITGDFTSLDGTYYFGPLSALATGCFGGAKTWNGSTWIPAGPPNNTHDVVINGNYNTATADIEACTLTINGSATVTVGAGDYIRSQGDITVAGSLLVEHQGSLVQVDDAATVTNNGVISVFVDTPELDGRDFMLLGSPTSTDTRQGVFAGAQRVRNHLTGSFSPNSAVASTSPGAGNWVDEEGDDWPVYTGVNINPGEGYMVMRNINGPPESLNLAFNTGTLNNGIITYAAGYNGTQNSSPNIISNPYASAISATDFINENTSVDAVYFWEHRTTPTGGIPGPYGLDYTMEDISLFNLTGGTSAAASDPSTTPNGIISTGQGFAVKVASAGLISFKNAMRRTSGNSTLRSQDFDRVWLNVQSEGYELNSTALIGFLDQATNGIDVGYDANRLATNVSLYSHLDDGSAMLGIQARGVFEENIKISMGFATLIDDALAYSISLQNIEGLNLSTATAYLIDNQLDTVTNLNETNYTFVSKKGVFNNRFTLQFTPEVVLGVNNNTLEKLSVYPNPTQNTVTIVSPQIAVRSATVYDLRGRSVAEVDFSNTTSYQIDLSAMESALYFIEIATESGLVMKRIIKN